MNGLIRCITMLMMALNTTSCVAKQQPTITVYGTPAFVQKQKQLKYRIAEAAALCADYLRQQNQPTDSSWLKLDILYGDHYVFKTRPYAYNLKLADYYLSGIWVNGETGEIKNVEKGGRIRLVLEYGKHIPFVYRLSGTPKPDIELDMDCEETLKAIIQSSNLGVLKTVDDVRFRIERMDSEGILVNVYTTNNLSDDPEQKQLVENAVAWVNYVPETQKLFNVTADPEAPVELNYDTNLSGSNDIEQLCGLIGSGTSTGTTDCTTISGDMLSGTQCLEKNSTIAKVYEKIIRAQLVEDAQYLKLQLPKSDRSIKDLKGGALRVDYRIKPGNVLVEMLYDGGVTHIQLIEKGNDVVRKVIYRAD